MSNRKTRFKRGVLHNNTIGLPTVKCPNCGEMCRGGHFVPPLCGEGYYICTPKRYKHRELK
jgi:ribosomal protein L32